MCSLVLIGENFRTLGACVGLVISLEKGKITIGLKVKGSYSKAGRLDR